jgi:hypothetical protein
MRKLARLRGLVLLMSFVECAVMLCAATAQTKAKPAYHNLIVKAANWPLHATKVCAFFGISPKSATVGCWDNEDNENFYNRGNHENDNLYRFDVDMPKEIYERLSQGHNAKLYCVRDSYTRMSCAQ